VKPETNFSFALKCVKIGRKISRQGWNASGQYVVYQPGYPDGIGINANTAEATGIPRGTVMAFRPYLMLHTAQGDLVPWAPSVSDVLADDWTFSGGDAPADSVVAPAAPVYWVRGEPDLPDLSSATITSTNVTIDVSTRGGPALTGTQIEDLTRAVQAALLQQAKRGRATGIKLPVT
jgi:hypothetical protein